MKIAWFVVDTVNRIDNHHLQHPSKHERQQKIAIKISAGRKERFLNCAFNIDGLLVLIEKLSGDEANHLGVGRKYIFVEAKINLALTT